MKKPTERQLAGAFLGFLVLIVIGVLMWFAFSSWWDFLMFMGVVAMMVAVMGFLKLLGWALNTWFD